MRRNLLLILAIIVSVILVVNGTKRIMTFRSNSQKVEEAATKLERLRSENEALKKELDYKKSQEFAESEIRNKLGLAKEGETVVIVPKDDRDKQQVISNKKDEKANWQKWRDLLRGT